MQKFSCRSSLAETVVKDGASSHCRKSISHNENCQQCNTKTQFLKKLCDETLLSKLSKRKTKTVKSVLKIKLMIAFN